MHDITKHDTKEEWEGNACKQCWVCLFVSWNTISINNQLECTCEFINFEVCWLHHRNIIRAFFNNHLRSFHASTIVFINNNLIKFDLFWAPHQSMEHLTILRLMQMIHMNQNLFLSHNKQLKNLQLRNISLILWLVKINQQ